MAGSRFVQSARTSATFFAANALRTSAVFNTRRLLTWHVTHHAAVKSTNTARPAPVNSATVAGVNAAHSADALGADDGFSPAVFADADESASASTVNSGHASTAA